MLGEPTVAHAIECIHKSPQADNFDIDMHIATEMGKAVGPSMAELIDWALMRRERMANERTP
nr:hypothetical protein [Rhizobium sp. BK650]